METLQIKKENALKAYNNGCDDVKTVLSNLFGKETFTPKDITDLVKTFADACEVLGVKLPEFSIENSNGFSNNDSKSLIAYAQLVLIVRALNEGWKPDWNNSSQYKYYPWFKMSGSGLAYHGFVSWSSDTLVGSRLCYKSKELAEYAGKQFISIYNDFRNL